MNAGARSLEALVAGTRVAFVNGIRSDIPSGGNTATGRLLQSLRPVCTLRLVEMTPRAALGKGMLSRLLFLVESMPGPVAIVLLRRFQWLWLEFFLRVSPVYAVRCLWLRLVVRPEFVIFNQHPTFFYAMLFKGCRRILVWHDVPSFKRDGRAATRRAAKRCAWLERRIIAHAEFHVTFSFDERKALRRLHGRHAFVVPVVDNVALPRPAHAGRGGLVLVGNWVRIENTEGALRLVEACARLPAPPMLHFAGHGAGSFVTRLKAEPALARLPLRVTARFGDMREFDEQALLAPILRGAGIKLKTIEAWASGIPVLGTRQAFTGLPPSIWKLGGVRLDDLDAMARLCADPAALAAVCGRLDPLAAFARYQQALVQSAPRG